MLTLALPIALVGLMELERGASGSSTASPPARWSPRCSRPTARARSSRRPRSCCTLAVLPPPGAAQARAAGDGPRGHRGQRPVTGSAGRRSWGSSPAPTARRCATVSDRASDYDAVRPDVWSHLAFGRGWGSYNHVTTASSTPRSCTARSRWACSASWPSCSSRLGRARRARATIASPRPARAPAALVGAAGAVAFLVAATLYDVLSFPHGAYIFLYIAGLVTVVIRPGATEEPDSKTAAALADHARRVRRRPPARRRGRIRQAPGAASQSSQCSA